MVVSGILYFVYGEPLSSNQLSAVGFQTIGIILVQTDPCKGAPLLAFQTYLLCLASVLLSAFSGVWNSKIVQKDDLSIDLLNAILYAQGLVLNVTLHFGKEMVYGGPGLFEGFTPYAWLVVLVQSLMGIAITYTYKYAGVLSKTFAVATATCFLILIGLHFEWGSPPPLSGWLGIASVVMATHLFATSRVASQ